MPLYKYYYEGVIMPKITDNLINNIEIIVNSLDNYWDIYSYYKRKYDSQTDFNQVMQIARPLYINKLDKEALNVKIKKESSNNR